MNTNSINSSEETLDTQELSFQEYINLQHGEARARAIIWAWHILNDTEAMYRPQIHVGQRNFNFRITINRMETIIRNKANEEREI